MTITSARRVLDPVDLGLRGTSFTKELDVTVEEWRSLMDLSAQVKDERTIYNPSYQLQPGPD